MEAYLINLILPFSLILLFLETLNKKKYLLNF